MPPIVAQPYNTAAANPDPDTTPLQAKKDQVGMRAMAAAQHPVLLRLMRCGREISDAGMADKLVAQLGAALEGLGVLERIEEEDVAGKGGAASEQSDGELEYADLDEQPALPPTPPRHDAVEPVAVEVVEEEQNGDLGGFEATFMMEVDVAEQEGVKDTTKAPDAPDNRSERSAAMETDTSDEETPLPEVESAPATNSDTRMESSHRASTTEHAVKGVVHLPRPRTPKRKVSPPPPPPSRQRPAGPLPPPTEGIPAASPSLKTLHSEPQPLPYDMRRPSPFLDTPKTQDKADHVTANSAALSTKVSNHSPQIPPAERIAVEGQPAVTELTKETSQVVAAGSTGDALSRGQHEQPLAPQEPLKDLRSFKHKCDEASTTSSLPPKPSLDMSASQASASAAIAQRSSSAAPAATAPQRVPPPPPPPVLTSLPQLQPQPLPTLDEVRATLAQRLKPIKPPQLLASPRLADFFGHLVFHSFRAYGSRDICALAEMAQNWEVRQAMQELLPDLVGLSLDGLAHHVVDAFIARASISDLLAAANAVKPFMVPLSQHQYGHTTLSRSAQQICLRLPPEQRPDLLLPLLPFAHQAAVHISGNKFVNIALGTPQVSESFASALEPHTIDVVQHQYGKFLIERLLTEAKPQIRTAVVKRLAENWDLVSVHPFANGTLAYAAREKMLSPQQIELISKGLVGKFRWRIARGASMALCKYMIMECSEQIREKYVTEMMQRLPDGSLGLPFLVRNDQFAPTLAWGLRGLPTTNECRERFRKALAYELGEMKREGLQYGEEQKRLLQLV
ncbi:hypothetical protein JCM10296v2_004406 [Rhodotorula toruloides]